MKKTWVIVGGIVVVLVIGFVIVDRNTRRIGSPPASSSYADQQPTESYTLSQLDAAVASRSVPNVRLPSPPAIVPGGGIDVTAAPGVAFSYSYAFRLPNANIAVVQEQHAQACEKLGIDRCRITGMRYTVSDKDDVRAMLAFKLAPDLARQFGKDGIAAIQKAQGSLVDAAISGVDVGSSIDQSRRRTAAIESRIRMFETRLRDGVDRDTRTVLQNQIESLRADLEREAQSRADTGEALATTPMVFQYNSGSALSTSALGEAWATATSSFIGMIGLFIIALGMLLPWVVLAGLIYLAVRPALRRWHKNATRDAPSIEEQDTPLTP